MQLHGPLSSYKGFIFLLVEGCVFLFISHSKGNVEDRNSNMNKSWTQKLIFFYLLKMILDPKTENLDTEVKYDSNPPKWILDQLPEDLDSREKT